MYSMDREETRRTNLVASDSAVVGEGEGDGDDVIVHPSISTEDARKIFPDMRVVKPYLRFTPLPKEKTSANI